MVQILFFLAGQFHGKRRLSAIKNENLEMALMNKEKCFIAVRLQGRSLVSTYPKSSVLLRASAKKVSVIWWKYAYRNKYERGKTFSEAKLS